MIICVIVYWIRYAVLAFCAPGCQRTKIINSVLRTEGKFSRVMLFFIIRCSNGHVVVFCPVYGSFVLQMLIKNQIYLTYFFCWCHVIAVGLNSIHSQFCIAVMCSAGKSTLQTAVIDQSKFSIHLPLQCNRNLLRQCHYCYAQQYKLILVFMFPVDKKKSSF